LDGLFSSTQRVRGGGAGLDKARLAAGQVDHVRVADPVGRGDDDLVARVQGGDEGVVDDRLAARRDVHLGRLVGQAVFAGELGADGFLQFRDAVDVGVLGLAGVDGGDGRLLDVVGGVEVGLAGAQADDVATFALQQAGFRRDRDGGGRLDAGQSGGFERHR
jgi:hypothetical protein